MEAAELKGKVDFGILTIREDEHEAVLRRLPQWETVNGRRRYRVRRLPLPNGESYVIAVLRCVEQGTTEALNAARDLLEDLEPAWLLVVGIAGGVPASEYTLGDVIVSTRIADFSVEAVLADRTRTYALGGGPLHPDAAKIAGDVSAMVAAGELGGWNDPEAIGVERPPADLSVDRFYGDEAWRNDVREKLTNHFSGKPVRGPLVVTGTLASSDRLLKDAELLRVWLTMARQVHAIEMESAGVYRAAHGRSVPFLAIRGISDVIGFKRHPDWTAYACETAAAFTRALLLTRPIAPRAADRGALPWPPPASRVARANVALVVPTTAALQPHVNAALNAIRTLDSWVPRTIVEDSADRCNSEIASSDVVIVVEGRDHGPRAYGTSMSMAHHGYRTAAAAGKPVLAFFERLPRDSQVSAPVQTAELATFRRELLSEKVVDFYSSPEELASRVKKALHNWKFQQGLPASYSMEPLPPQPRIEHPYPMDRHFTGRRADRATLTGWLDGVVENVLVLEAIGGVGKSALAWFWSQFDVLGAPAPDLCSSEEARMAPCGELEGMFWWSFYEPNSRFPEFLRAAEEYARGAEALSPRDLQRSAVDRVAHLLRKRRILFVLDGFERELCSYREGYHAGHGDLPPDGDSREARQCIDPDAALFLKAVTSMPALRSRVLLTSRLFPLELEDRSGLPLPGCKRVAMTGLEPEDVIELFHRSGAFAPASDVRAIAESYGHLPLAMRLLIGVILGDPLDSDALGAVKGYNPIPHLIQKRNHILQVAYDSLSRPNQELLSGIAAYRGPVDDERINVVERARAHHAREKVRDRSALKSAIRALLSRNLLLREERRGVFDLHPIVRKYAYDRLVNKRDVHLALSHYFQSFATSVPIAERADLNAVVELFHQQISAGMQEDALRLLSVRLFTPLVRQFCDVRTALELFSSLVPDEQPLASTWNAGDVHAWFNEEHAILLRRSGFALRARCWRSSAELAVRQRITVFSNASTISRQGATATVETVRNLRSLGLLSRALETSELHAIPEWRAAFPAEELQKDTEYAISLACVGRTDEAERILADIVANAPRAKKLQGALSARALRHRSRIALWHGRLGDALTLVRTAGVTLQSHWSLDPDTLEEAIEVVALEAFCVAAMLAPSGAHAALPANRPARGVLVPLAAALSDKIRLCREHGLVEVEIDALIALSAARLALGDMRTAIDHVESSLSLSERGGYRLARADALFMSATITSYQGDAVRALDLATAAELAAECDGGDHRYQPIVSAVRELREELGCDRAAPPTSVAPAVEFVGDRPWWRFWR